MTETVVFDFTNQQVYLRGASGESAPTPEEVVLVGTSASPPSPDDD